MYISYSSDYDSHFKYRLQLIGWQYQEACVHIHPTKIIKIEHSVKREIEESGQIKNPSVGFTLLQNFDNKKTLCELVQ